MLSRICVFCLVAISAHATLVIRVRTNRGIVFCADKRVKGLSTRRGYADDYIKVIPHGEGCVYAVTGVNSLRSRTQLLYSVNAVIEKFLDTARCGSRTVDLQVMGKEIERSMLASLQDAYVDVAPLSSVIILIQRDETGELRTGHCTINTRVSERVPESVTSDCSDTSADRMWAYGDTSLVDELRGPVNGSLNHGNISERESKKPSDVSDKRRSRKPGPSYC